MMVKLPSLLNAIKTASLVLHSTFSMKIFEDSTATLVSFGRRFPARGSFKSCAVPAQMPHKASNLSYESFRGNSLLCSF